MKSTTLFSDNAVQSSDEILFNQEHVDDLLYWIESESMVLIKGPEKSGKTRLAFEVIDQYKGSIIYIDMNTYNKEIDIGHLLVGSQPWHRKLFNKKPKNMILIIDNAHNLDTDFYERLQYFFDQKYLQSVLFIEREDKPLELPKSIVSRIGHKTITLKEISKEESILIMNQRLQGLLEEEHLEHIWKKSKSFQTFVSLCEKVIEAYANDTITEINQKTIKQVN